MAGKLKKSDRVRFPSRFTTGEFEQGLITEIDKSRPDGVTEFHIQCDVGGMTAKTEEDITIVWVKK